MPISTINYTILARELMQEFFFFPAKSWILQNQESTKMEPLLIIPIFLGFFLTFFFVPVWIKRARQAGFIGKDIHKISKKDVAEIGGVSVLIGFIFGILAYVAIKTFYFKTTDNLIEIFALLNVILMVSFIGL